MKKEADEIEQRLLSNASLDELIKMKMEQELQAELEKSKEKPQKETITDISKVSVDLVFSKKAVYKVFNRVNKTESYVNGMQAEAMLGLQSGVREKIKLGQTDAFSTEDSYVKFEKVELV